MKSSRALAFLALVTLCLTATGCGGRGDNVSLSHRGLSTARPTSTGAAPQFTAFNASGFARTINVAGQAVNDPTNPFNQNLGTNGRSCTTCHTLTDNMTITPSSVQARFNATGGTDPVFRPVDGSNAPVGYDFSTVTGRRQAYSLLLNKAVIRIGLPIPVGADFVLDRVSDASGNPGDPYGFVNTSADTTGELSLFRRPIPSTSLKFLSTIMWDGRESSSQLPGQPLVRKLFSFGMPAADDLAFLFFDLSGQSNSATLTHAQAMVPGLTSDEESSIVDFETRLFTAQVFDNQAGDLRANGARGGPDALGSQGFNVGTNDVVFGDPSGTPFNPVVVTAYDAWRSVPGGGTNAARQAVNRGQAIFNTRTFTISGVAGLNGATFTNPLTGTSTGPLPDSLPGGTCTVCHDTPGPANHSVPLQINIGIADPPVGTTGHTAAGLDVHDMPVYTLRRLSDNATVQATDPGRALITGKFSDIGKFKGATLRGPAGRAPYFHNGSAASIEDVVNFYNRRFNMGLTDQEASDLAAFLRTL